jgi:uncharacterized protein
MPPEPEYGMVLTHGAGSDRNSPLLVAVAEELAGAGVDVLRYDLPFRQRRRGPPYPSEAAGDREGLRSVAREMRAEARRSVFLGGHSYGGRQASILAAEDPTAADALLLLSYPLHPPRKPRDLRTAHFPNLRTPAIFIHGARDPFGSIAELEEALRLVPARTSLIAVSGATHDLLRGRSNVAAFIAEQFLNFVGPL